MKRVKIISAVVMLAAFVLISPYSSTSAHILTDWSEYYPAAESNGVDNFGIIDGCHVNGRKVNFKWNNSTVKSYFNTALIQAESMWGNLIDAIEVSSNGSFEIQYDPDPTNDFAGYVIVESGEHYIDGQHTTKMVIANITEYTALEKSQVFAHELGHLWAIDDLYDYYSNLQSIYSNSYAFTSATRHDKNAMYICQDRPWYKDSSGNWKFLKSPGRFAVNEWAYTIGNEPTSQNAGRYYFGGNGVFVSNADSQYKKTYTSYSVGSVLAKGQTLLENQYLSSPNNKFIAIMQSDGNFAVYNTDNLLWSANTNLNGTGARRIMVQPDGNIVVYDSNGTALWSMWWQSGTNNRMAVKLAMQDDGNLVAYDSNNSPIWFIGSNNSGINKFNVIRENNKNSCTDLINGAENMGTTLFKNQTLQPNQYLSSVNKKFIAIIKADGNFAVYNTDGILWSSNTSGKGSGNCYIKVQPDENIVLYDSTGKALWHTWGYAGVNKHKANRLVLQEDGNLVAYSSEGIPVWWTNTNGAFGEGVFNIS